jgi:hypothetical protein
MSQKKTAYLPPLTDEEIDAANDAASEILHDLDEALAAEPAYEGVVHYALCVSLTRLLAHNGWTAKELARDAASHASPIKGDQP